MFTVNVKGYGTLGFGCVQLSTLKSQKVVLRLLEEVYQNGINYFDTAPLYGQGYSEKLLGSFIKTKPREQLIITTKFGLPNRTRAFIPGAIVLPLNYWRKRLSKKTYDKIENIPGPGMPNEFREITRNEIKQSITQSLQNLRCDYIDNFLLHEGMPHFLTEEAIGFLYDLKKQGVIKKLGIGANYATIASVDAVDIMGWDILQYENGPGYNTDFLLEKFPEQTHHYHSILRYKGGIAADIVEPDKHAGYLLAHYLKSNKAGVVLFSTSKSSHLLSNLATIQEFL